MLISFWMAYKIILTQTFQADFKRLRKKYPSLPADLLGLLDEFQKNPKTGTSIGMNCYKIRMAIGSKNKGKSGGARIISHFVVHILPGTLYLITMYDKGEKDTITAARLKELLKDID